MREAEYWLTVNHTITALGADAAATALKGYRQPAARDDLQVGDLGSRAL
jgi:hypothetical protein